MHPRTGLIGLAYTGVRVHAQIPVLDLMVSKFSNGHVRREILLEDMAYNDFC